jgi:hypothetical protein
MCRIGFEGRQYFAFHTGQSCAHRFSPWLLLELTPSSKTIGTNWRKNCNICVMNRIRIELAGAQSGAPQSFLFRNAGYIPRGERMLSAGKAVKDSVYPIRSSGRSSVASVIADAGI